MKKLYGNSFVLDTSIGVNNAIYLSPNVKQTMTNSFCGKQDLYDQNLQCNLFLFLSIVHGNQQLNRLFIQRCLNKDKFLQLYDTQQFSILLTKVLQIVNQYFTDHYPSQQQHINFNKSFNFSDQKLLDKSASQDKFQSMMKKILISPQHNLKNRSTASQVDQLPDKMSQKLMKTNILKEQLKDKITKLAMQNSYYCQFKFLKTDSELPVSSSKKILKESQSQTVLSQELISHKPNRISFGQQNLFCDFSQDQIVEGPPKTSHKNGIESSPTFVHQQYEDHCVQTMETEDVYASPHKNNLKLDLNDEKLLKQNPNYKIVISTADQGSQKFDGTFGKDRSKFDKQRKKSNSVSESHSPEKSARLHGDVLSIDQIQRKRKISINSVNRNFNILTNEQLE